VPHSTGGPHSTIGSGAVAGGSGADAAGGVGVTCRMGSFQADGSGDDRGVGGGAPNAAE
jgi:hypothetical protein